MGEGVWLSSWREHSNVLIPQGRASHPGTIKLSEAFLAKATVGLHFLLWALTIPTLVSGKQHLKLSSCFYPLVLAALNQALRTTPPQGRASVWTPQALGCEGKA